MLLMLTFESAWTDFLALLLAVAFLKTAITGIWENAGRASSSQQPVASWLRPVFAIAGFALFAYGLSDFFRRIANWRTVSCRIARRIVLSLHQPIISSGPLSDLLIHRLQYLPG